MTDPYQAPGAPLGPPSPSPPLSQATIAFALIVASVPAFAIVAMVPRFAEVFVNFGAEMPALTRLFAGNPWLGFAWPALVAIDAWRVRRPNGGGRGWFLGRAVLGSLLLATVFVFAMYLPIFQLAATV
jgi:hypothetical protein